MRLLNKDTRYSVRALAFMAGRSAADPKKLVSVDMLAREEKMPRNYLRKLLQILAREKLLRSHKGKKGGFSFLRNPEDITMADIIAIFQGEIEEVDCFVEGHLCGRNRLCVLRSAMMDIHQLVKKEFSKITIASLIINRKARVRS